MKRALIAQPDPPSRVQGADFGNPERCKAMVQNLAPSIAGPSWSLNSTTVSTLTMIR